MREHTHNPKTSSFSKSPSTIMNVILRLYPFPVNWYLERWLHLSGNALKQVTTWHMLKVQVLHWQKLSVENHINPTYHCFLTGPSSLESIIWTRWAEENNNINLEKQFANMTFIWGIKPANPVWVCKFGLTQPMNVPSLVEPHPWHLGKPWTWRFELHYQREGMKWFCIASHQNVEM